MSLSYQIGGEAGPEALGLLNDLDAYLATVPIAALTVRRITQFPDGRLDVSWELHVNGYESQQKRIANKIREIVEEHSWSGFHTVPEENDEEYVLASPKCP